MTTKDSIHRLICDRATGKKPDLVGFVDQLLLVADAVGQIQCFLVDDDDNRLRFTTPAEPSFEIELNHGRGKLRWMCARLAVLSNESGNGVGEISPYGGEGIIRLPGITDACANGVANKTQSELQVKFHNTPGDVWFTIEKPSRRV